MWYITKKKKKKLYTVWLNCVGQILRIHISWKNTLKL